MRLPSGLSSVREVLGKLTFQNSSLSNPSKSNQTRIHISQMKQAIIPNPTPLCPQQLEVPLESPLSSDLQWTCRSSAMAAHQSTAGQASSLNIGGFSASCVAAASPKAAIAIASTDNSTWHHNFKFQSKLLYHQQRGQHSHWVAIGVCHWWPQASWSSSTPAPWFCSCLYHAREQGTKKLYWKASWGTSAFLNACLIPGSFLELGFLAKREPG